MLLSKKGNQRPSLRLLPIARRCAWAVWLVWGAGLLLLVGCRDQPPTSYQEVMDQLLGTTPPPPIPVGILFSQTGTMAISETQLRHAAIQAIDEINAQGGVLGRSLIPVIRDGRSREDIFTKRAEELVAAEVPVIFGGWRSVDRQAMIPVVEEADVLLFYPLQYEGNEASRHVFYGGLTPNQQVLPALEWMMGDDGGARKRVFLVGSDYVFPRTVNHIVRKFLEDQPMEVVGESYFPFGHSDFAQTMAAIRDAEADLILSTINGESNLAFFRQYAEAGLEPEEVPILATSIGEAGLRSIQASHTQGHYAAWTFFQSLKTEPARTFVEAFQQEYGSDRPVHDPMEAVYTQVYLWREAVEKAGSLSADAVRQVLEETIEFEGPGGRVRIDPRNHHTYKRLRVGRILADQQFEIVYESPEWIRPEPFPSFAFPGWECDWTKGGLKQGPVVDLGD
jgi:urea ABC transporter urea binding protein